MGEPPPSLSGLLDLPVRHRGITLGHVSDVLLGDDYRPLGLEVYSVGDERAFLPWPSFDLGEGELRVPAPLALLSETELVYYRRAGRSLRESVATGAIAPDEPAVAAR
jgi:hypothetical protein